MTSVADHDPYDSLRLRPPTGNRTGTTSSRELALLMTAAIGRADGPVIELGAGTGKFTHALLARGVREQDLILVERDSSRSEVLRERFPAARVVNADAARLNHHYPFVRLAGAVVSGLPMLSMPQPQVISTLSVAFSLLRNTGAFYQFTHGPCCPVQHELLKESELAIEWVGRIAGDPSYASVYRFRSTKAFPTIVPKVGMTASWPPSDRPCVREIGGNT